jgi:hypothetical protein
MIVTMIYVRAALRKTKRTLMQIPMAKSQERPKKKDITEIAIWKILNILNILEE